MGVFLPMQNSSFLPSPNDPDSDGNTPLHLAVLSKDITMVKTLLRAGAKTTLPNNQGKTVWDIAKEDEYTEMIKILSNLTQYWHRYSLLSPLGYSTSGTSKDNCATVGPRSK